MTMWDEPTYPPATAPLLDQGNVGKYVWVSYNGNRNRSTPVQILKVGRSNIHVDYGHGGFSLPVDTGGMTASKMVRGFSYRAMTLEAINAASERSELEKAVKALLINISRTVTNDQLRRIIAIGAESGAA